MTHSVLIVDPVLASRMRFKQVAQATSTFSTVRVSSSLADGLARLRQTEPFSLIYLANRLDGDLVPEFVSSAQSNQAGAAAAFLMVAPTGSSPERDAGRWYCWGIDGVLLEPFSPSDLEHSAEQATRVRKERASETRANIGTLSSLAVRLVDMRWADRRNNRENPRTADSIQKLTSTIDTLEPEDRARYLERLIDAFIEAPCMTSPKAMNVPNAQRIVRRR